MNVDFVSFAKAVLPDKFPIVIVGALLDKTNVWPTARLAVLNVLPVLELVLPKALLTLR